MSRAFDVTLAGQVLVRLVDPSPADVRAVGARLGIEPVATDPAAGAAATSAALVLRFVEGLDAAGPLATVGRDDGAFDGTSFYVRRGARLVARVPFEAIGTPGAEIEVVRGTGAPARFVSLLNLSLLAGPRVATHGSAVEHGGLGVLACGWSGGGKTEILLGLTARGARFVGDEWVLVSDEGRMTGLPQPVRLERRHLEEVPALTGRVGRVRRARMQAAGAVETAGAAVGRRGPRAAGRAIRAAGRVAGRGHVDLAPGRLFGAARIATEVALDRIVLLEPGLDDGIRMEPTDPETVADRLALAHVHHRRELLGWYWQFRFAYPSRTNDLLERNADIERDRLRARFTGRPAWRLVHPGGAPIAALADAIEASIR